MRTGQPRPRDRRRIERSRLLPLRRALFQIGATFSGVPGHASQQRHQGAPNAESAGRQRGDVGAEHHHRPGDMTIQNLTPAKTAIVRHLFGPNNVALYSTPRSYTATAVGRANDTPPWNGGDFLLDTPSFTGECTSGFGAHKGSTSYMITAGHCFPVGTSANPEYAVNGAPSTNGPAYYEVGVVQTRGSFTKPNGIDAELLNASGAGNASSAIYTGSSSAPQVATVRGTLSSPLNTQVCDSGAFEGEICGLVIKSGSECITESEGPSGPNYTVCNIYEADNTKGGIAVGNGDSGGPVFRFSGSSLYAVGDISAQSGTTVKCPTNQYPGVLSTRYCGSKLFYTNISSILSEFGLTLNT
jgi:hypothetical protein